MALNRHKPNLLTPLRGLLPSEKRDLARQYKILAAQLEQWADAEDKGRRNTDRTKQAIQRRHGIPEAIQAKIASGCLDTLAPALVARELGLSIKVVEYHWREHQKDMAAQKKARRNREILRLAARGLSNSEIAARVGLSQGWVSRIIQRSLNS